MRLTGSTLPIERRPPVPDDPRQRRPDISLAKDTLGWQPRTGLDAGLARTVADFRHRIEDIWPREKPARGAGVKSTEPCSSHQTSTHAGWKR